MNCPDRYHHHLGIEQSQLRLCSLVQNHWYLRSHQIPLRRPTRSSLADYPQERGGPAFFPSQDLDTLVPQRR